MTDSNRRGFLRQSLLGVSAGALWLPGAARPTEASGTLGDFAEVLAREQQHLAPVVAHEATAIPAAKRPASFTATEDNILGPYFRQGAPYRAKVTPPLEPGTPMVIRGRVWAMDTRQPIPGALLHIWQANAKGRYDNDDQNNPPKRGVFYNRARIQTDETGYYEFETIKPGHYSIGQNRFRPAHIHYAVVASGYQQLITQLYFKGDPHNAKDDFIKPSLIIDPETVETPHGKFQLGTFDIVLPKK